METRRLRVGLFLVAVMLLLRIFRGGIGYLTRPNSPEWPFLIEMIATYPLTCVLFWWERDHLADFHITGLAIGIIVFAPVLKLIILSLTDNAISLPRQLILGAEITISVLLFLALWFRKRRIKASRDKIHWLFVALVVGVVLGVSCGSCFESQNYGQTNRYAWKPPGKLDDLLALVITNLLGAAVMEEPLFRGFLWGYLRKLGWKDVRIWILQAVLFGMSHIYYLGYESFAFWILVPGCALMFGILAWRPRSIATSMLAHALVNGVASFTMRYNLSLTW